MSKIQNVKQARQAIGEKVFWDEISTRWKFIRSGILLEVEGKNLNIDGNWLWRTNLTNLRTTEIES